MVTIEVKHRMVHDQDRMDVCNHTYQEAISQLTGRKTVTKKDLDCLKVLGCQVVDVDEYIKDLSKKYPEVERPSINKEAEEIKQRLLYAWGKAKGQNNTMDGFFVFQSVIRDIIRDRL